MDIIIKTTPLFKLNSILFLILTIIITYKTLIRKSPKSSEYISLYNTGFFTLISSTIFFLISPLPLLVNMFLSNSKIKNIILTFSIIMFYFVVSDIQSISLSISLYLFIILIMLIQYKFKNNMSPMENFEIIIIVLNIISSYIPNELIKTGILTSLVLWSIITKENKTNINIEILNMSG